MSTAESLPHLDLDAAPSWEPEAALHRALSAVNQIRASASSTGIALPECAIVRDYLSVKPVRGFFYCNRGRTSGTTSRAKGTASVQRHRCYKADCLSCVPVWIEKILKQCFAAWNGAPLYVLVWPNYDSWRTGRYSDFRAEYKGRFLRIVQGDGSQLVVFPGKPGEGTPLPDPAMNVLAYLLDAPAFSNGMRRVQLPKAPRPEPRDDQHADQPEEKERDIHFHIPRYVPIMRDTRRASRAAVDPAYAERIVGLEHTEEKVCALVQETDLQPNRAGNVRGYLFAHVLAERAVGRELSRVSEQDLRQDLAAQWKIWELTPDEERAVRRVWQKLHDYEVARRAEYNRLKKEEHGIPEAWMPHEAVNF